MANSSFFTASGVSTKVINDLDTITEEAKAYKDAAAVSAAEAATDAAIIKADINTAVSSASSAQLSAAEAANSAADTIGREVASEASAVASEASSVASAASAVASEASKVTAVASAVGATASELAAGTSASTASTKASEASTSATNAATSASNAATSDTGAAAQATIATTKASEALTSADNSALSASASASSAVTSAAEATASAASATAAASSATASANSATESAVSAASIVGDVADAQAAATETLGYRDTANLHKLAAEAAATSATNTASALVGFDLEAIAANKAVTAKDVFVYDTSKDSDGGAWRKRTQGTSWYQETLNTATRGSRREFPSVAVIVAETNKVTIYDGDDPALPMWMVFEGASLDIFMAGGAVTSVVMVNGLITVGATFDVFTTSFVSERSLRYLDSSLREYSGSIAERNDGLGYVTISSTNVIVNRTVNDVAMTVLPDAPVDAATGLPVPTIAVGCGVTGQANGGTSIIHNDGTVVDIVANTGAGGYACYDLAFGPNHELITTQSYLRSYLYVHVFDVLPTSDIAATSSPAGARTYSFTASPSFRGSLGGGPQVDSIVAASGEIIGSGGAGTGTKLMRLFEDKSTQTNGMVAYTTSSYNTGWMNGDIKGAFLSSTDATSLVGGDLVTNGTFDTDIAGWSASTALPPASFVWDGVGAMTVTGSGDPFGGVNYPITCVVGETYSVSSDITGTGYVSSSTSTGGWGPTNNITSFVATATTMYIVCAVGGSNVATFDNVSVQPVEADRSVNNNGLTVNGTVTRSPVATGAELVAYSGFSASNYLEQPYNADLDFGTGDFCVMGWVQQTAGVVSYIFERRDTAGTGNYIRAYLDGNTDVIFGTTGKTLVGTRDCGLNQWSHVCCVRKDAVMYIYVNGELDVSTSGGFDIDSATARLRFGCNHTSGQFFQGNLALLRISATAPTAEQIRKIYNDEKVLFQENAACTLYGTSDAVTALAHDSDTDLLHVGTSAGRSVFDGLRRVSNTTTAVGTAISASNGLVVEE